MDNQPPLEFQLLALDTLEESMTESELNLLHSFLGIGSIWTIEASIDQKGLKITDGDVSLEAKKIAFQAESDLKEDINKAFLITIKGSYHWLESKRKLIVKFLGVQKFNFVYILVDETSERIAEQLYPFLYKVENNLRAYITKFMTTRIGPNWWKITATSDLNQKVKNRKNNEKEFSPHIDNNIYLIDFGDLGGLIHTHSSGFTNKEDILKKVQNLEETPEAIKGLKQELQSNYQKFFKESFKDKQFQKKWEDLEKIRHKVAHNNLFTKIDLDEGKQLSKELLDIIDKAIKSADELSLLAEEREAIRESFASQEVFVSVTEEVFMEQLREQEEYFSRRQNGFVSLSKFVKNHLANQGYDIPSTYQLVKELEFQQKIEIYYVENPYSSENKTAAIKTVQSLTNQ